VAAAFRDGHDVVRPVRPDTIAKSLAIGNPADGPYVLDAVRRTGGAVEAVTDDEVRELLAMPTVQAG
jgi:threonine synthase